jgi:hypothetical protein
MQSKGSSASDQQDEQNQFVSWLADKLGAKSHEELQDKLKQMGPDGIKKAYEQFQQESQQQDGEQGQEDNNTTASMKEGGKLDYIKCLQAFKKGGAMEAKKCGCGDKLKKGGKAKSMQDGGSNQGSNSTAADNSTAVAKKGGSVVMNGRKQVGMKQTGGTLYANNNMSQPTPAQPVQTNTTPTVAPAANYIKPNAPVVTPQRNFTTTQDPNTVIGSKGATITRDQYTQAIKSGKINFPTFEDYADWVGGWANKEPTGAAPMTRPAATNSQPIMSDKANGNSSTYYSPVQQNRAPAIPTQHASANYYKKGGAMNNPAKSGHYDVPVSKAGSRMSKVDGDSPQQDGPQPKGTGIAPKWAKKAVKGKDKPKSNDVKQDHHKGNKKAKPEQFGK